MFFSLSSLTVALLVLAVVGSFMVGGRPARPVPQEALGCVARAVRRAAGALLGVVGLILAFGLSLAVGRYEDRRAAVVAEANAIGTTYLRAQLLAEPERSRSLALLREYTDLAIRLAHDVPRAPT